MAIMVYRTCCQVEGGLPTNIRIQMLINIILDFMVGLVPFLGDLVDAVFRANTRNAALLEDHLRQKGKKELRKSGLPIPAVDPSSPEEYDRIQREDPPEYRSNPPSRQESPVRYDDRHHHEPRVPAAAAVRDDRGYTGRTRPHDVEMGQAESDRRPHGSSSHGAKKKSKWHGLF
jgi:hypothetical protein